MILSVRSNMPSFREVEFSPGFNVVLADRTMESTSGDSRNGLGKTTLIEIIHFCLGAQARPNQGLRIEPLRGWAFTLEIEVQGRGLIVTRSTDEPNRIRLEGDVDSIPGIRDIRDDEYRVRIPDWNAFLGEQFFGELYT